MTGSPEDTDLERVSFGGPRIKHLRNLFVIESGARSRFPFDQALVVRRRDRPSQKDYAATCPIARTKPASSRAIATVVLCRLMPLPIMR